MILLNKFISYDNGSQPNYILLFKNKIITIITSKDAQWPKFIMDIVSYPTSVRYLGDPKKLSSYDIFVNIQILNKDFYAMQQLYQFYRYGEETSYLEWDPYGDKSISITRLIKTCVNKLAIKFLAKIMHDYNLETRNKIRKMLF